MDADSSPSDIALNMPNASLMYTTTTPIFGNILFNIAPSPSGETNDSYGQIPYLSLESLIYMQQVQAAAQPTATVSGNMTGQQNITGALTVTGAAGNIQASIGSASSSTGSY